MSRATQGLSLITQGLSLFPCKDESVHGIGSTPVWMLGQVMTIVAGLVVACCLVTPARAQSYLQRQLSGKQVRAIYFVYHALPKSVRTGLSQGYIKLSAEKNSSFRILFSSPAMQQEFSVDVSAGRVSNANVASFSGSAMKVNWLDAKAIALVQSALISGKVSGISMQALQSGAFSLREAFVSDMGPTGLPASYVISYLPAGGSWESKPFPHCVEYVNYTVAPSDWRVLRQPKIC